MAATSGFDEGEGVKLSSRDAARGRRDGGRCAAEPAAGEREEGEGARETSVSSPPSDTSRGEQEEGPLTSGASSHSAWTPVAVAAWAAVPPPPLHRHSSFVFLPAVEVAAGTAGACARAFCLLGGQS